ncbi:probable asparagine synthetase [glutamine-hydrolyzing] [Anopheles albimanus]|uniref:Asparagine synthetase [glutamine-hydrolyzing] n=1 Tax=Anopheles albimanus TaxID=7167 RepID=A0A182F7U7_ANOAL|nr:probable asparagine synthetase [glutamine-hydrolyzing] [Anopheles albimanus]
MCGILCIFRGHYAENSCEKKHSDSKSLREIAFQASSKQRHRGPDHTGVLTDEEDQFALVQERLSVIGVKTGNQPFTSTDGTVHLVANGEIYNFRQMASAIGENRNGRYEPRSDCDVLGAYYELFGPEALLTTVRGMFAFVLYDRKGKRLLVARDPIGIIPLYVGWDAEGALWFASEMKCLVEHCPEVQVFPPGHFFCGRAEDYNPMRYFNPSWITEVPTCPADLPELRHRLETAVVSHLQCEVPMGALLSGGLDSSLIAAITARKLHERSGKCLKTYSIGLPGAGPDLHYARLVADHIGSDHTEIHFSVTEGLDYIRDAVYHAESYDVTTIRCTVPVMLLARYVRSEGLKMVLSGEGADELFGGYLYFHRAPTVTEFHHETVRRVQGLHLSDCLRANKGCAAWGLELRVPFLDTDFIQYAMSIRPEDRRPNEERLEKYILRQAFADGDYLPAEVLWRQKEQFSDGVGYSWIDTVSQWATGRVSDEEFSQAASRFPFATPKTKEAFYYRQLFEERFGGASAAQTVQRWIPRTDWGCAEDPSGRKQDVHCGVKDRDAGLK